MDHIKLDEVGYWTEAKLEIVRKYAKAYTTILKSKPVIRRYIYIDGFAGAGLHISRQTGNYVLGSPLNALNVDPPFHEFHFIDLDGDKAESLRRFTVDRSDVYVYEADCNDVLLEKVLPKAKRSDFRRALCLLDPYGLHLNWEVIETAGRMQSIEIFLNFPLMDMNMNVLWRRPDDVDKKQAARMDAFWGDRSWRDVAYKKGRDLFGDTEEKAGHNVIVEAFRCRLKEVAGFKFVPKPIPMRNTKGSILYYLFFASPNKTGAKIVGEIFSKYRDRGV